MKKIFIRLCTVAAIGLAVSACGSHDEKKANDSQPATVVPAPEAEKPKEPTEEHKTKPEVPNEHAEHHHHKDTTLVISKGLPVIKDTAALKEKPAGGGTMGSNTNADGQVKHHPKPGGLQGNVPKSN